MRLLAVLTGVLLSCQGAARPPSIPVDASVTMDAAVDAATDTAPELSPVDPCGPVPCGPTELCGPSTADGGTGHGNGLDDNCNGQVDEGCPCDQSEVRPCFPAPPDRRDIGSCHDGTMHCTELGAWIGNECAGATVPTAEICNGRDDDCNGLVDDGLPRCVSAVHCPAFLGARPLEPITLDGRAIDPTARGFQWTLECPSGVLPCPAVMAPTDPTLAVTLVSVGTYRVRVGITRADGQTEACSFPVHVQGDGLRVQMDWDRKGGAGGAGGAGGVGTDLDLHVSVIDRRDTSVRHWFTVEDCYFINCKAPGGYVQWSSGPDDHRFDPAPTAVECQNAPPPWGASWQSAGRCWNPRLDTDTIVCDPAVRDTASAAFCFPENIAVDEPPDDVTFRVAVNYYRDHGTCTDSDPGNDVSHPVLSIACGGIDRADIGSVDDGLVPMRCQDNTEIGSANWTWLAADVRFSRNACGVRDCRVTALRAQPGRFVACAGVSAVADVCEDTLGRVFVRHAGDRPVDAEIPESP